MNCVKEFLFSLIELIHTYEYRRTIPIKVRAMRQKEKIKVLFVLSDLSLWKSESLYRAMLEHPRFEPILGLCLLSTDKPTEVIRKFSRLYEYLNKRKYEYIEIYKNDISGIVRPDIIFYQQPYESFIETDLFFRNNRQSLFCHVSYAFNTIQMSWEGKLIYFHFCWQHYFENETTKAARDIVMPRFIRNGVVTGVPIQDAFASLSKAMANPWKNSSRGRIDAPIYINWNIRENKLAVSLLCSDFPFIARGEKVVVEQNNEVGRFPNHYLD